MSSEQAVAALLPWYAAGARRLPWRQATDAYGVWISEVMLQQTQVQTVIPFWNRWMKELPHVGALAEAPVERVLKLWEGLGYYTRARNLHRAAQLIVKEHSGVFPRSFPAILALPGIGLYTAGAICCIAFEQPVAAVDGNIARVLARLFKISGEVRSERAKSRIRNRCQELVEAAVRLRSGYRRPCGSLIQALMELGATVCVPKRPGCTRCPLNPLCLTRRAGVVAQFPSASRRLKPTAQRFVAFVVCRRERVLVRQRPDGVVNARLWEFPNLELNGRSVDELAQECLGFAPASLEHLCTIRHSITRFRIRLDVYRLDLASGKGCLGGTGMWCSATELAALAFPSAHRRIVEKLKSL